MANAKVDMQWCKKIASYLKAHMMGFGVRCDEQEILSDVLYEYAFALKDESIRNLKAYVFKAAKNRIHREFFDWRCKADSIEPDTETCYLESELETEEFINSFEGREKVLASEILRTSDDVQFLFDSYVKNKNTATQFDCLKRAVMEVYQWSPYKINKAVDSLVEKINQNNVVIF